MSHHLNTNHGKMSKSKGEFLTVSLLEEKGYDPLAYRFFCLQSHYRKGLVFTWENLDNASGRLQQAASPSIAALKPGRTSGGRRPRCEELQGEVPPARWATT